MEKAHDALTGAGAPEPWTARFVCVLCLARPDGTVETFRGEAEGRCVWPPRGDKGHGYDPMFVPEAGEGDLTFAEMDPDAKNAISHRAEAFAKLRAALETAA
jgi:XTP/dITP diphosphohydrolase